MSGQHDDTRVPAPLPLPTAVGTAMRVLGDLDRDADVTDRRVDALLRASLTHHVRIRDGQPDPSPDPASAVLMACAHLAVGAREDAYLALCTARDLLTPAAPVTVAPVGLRRRPLTPTARHVDDDGASRMQVSTSQECPRPR